MTIKAADREGRRSTLSVRLTPEGRERLEQAASASGRSLAQEVEMRLEKSFSEDGLLDEIFGSNRHSRLFVEAASTAMRRIEQIRESRWVDDYGTLWACRKAIEQVQGICLGYEITEPRCGDDAEENKKFVSYLAQLANSAAIEACRDVGLVAAAPTRGQLQHIAIGMSEAKAQKKNQD